MNSAVHRRIEFFLKDGTGGITGTVPPYLFCVTVPAEQVQALRSKAGLVLRSSGGDAQRFLASTLSAGTHENRGIREMVACMVVAMATDTPERLAAVLSGSCSRAGFLVTRNRIAEVAGALGARKTPIGGGISIAEAKPRWEFRYVAG